MAALVGCSAQQAGQLFCAIQTGGGGTIVAGIIDAAATAAAGPAAPVAVIATGATKSFVDGMCAAAAVAAGGTAGVAVSPPANPAAAPQVAVVTSGTAVNGVRQ